MRAHGDITCRSFRLERAGATLLLWHKEAKLASACREPLLISRDICVALEIRGQSGQQCGGRKVTPFHHPPPPPPTKLLQEGKAHGAGQREPYDKKSCV